MKTSYNAKQQNFIVDPKCECNTTLGNLNTTSKGAYEERNYVTLESLKFWGSFLKIFYEAPSVLQKKVKFKWLLSQKQAIIHV